MQLAKIAVDLGLSYKLADIGAVGLQDHESTLSPRAPRLLRFSQKKWVAHHPWVDFANEQQDIEYLTEVRLWLERSRDLSIDHAYMYELRRVATGEKKFLLSQHRLRKRAFTLWSPARGDVRVHGDELVQRIGLGLSEHEVNELSARLGDEQKLSVWLHQRPCAPTNELVAHLQAREPRAYSECWWPDHEVSTQPCFAKDMDLPTMSANNTTRCMFVTLVRKTNTIGLALQKPLPNSKACALWLKAQNIFHTRNRRCFTSSAFEHLTLRVTQTRTSDATRETQGALFSKFRGFYCCPFGGSLRTQSYFLRSLQKHQMQTASSNKLGPVIESARNVLQSV